MDVRSRIAELLQLTARKAAAEERIETIRAELHAEALTRLRDEGAAPAWKVRGMGSVTLAGADGKGELVVVDGAAFHAWASEAHPTETTRSASLTVDLSSFGPTEAEQVLTHLRAQVTELAAVGVAAEVTDNAGVRGVFAKALLNTPTMYREVPDPTDDEGPGQLMTVDGELVPGVVVRHKRYISCRLDPEAKARAIAEVRLTAEDPDDAAEAPDELDVEVGA